MWFRVVEFFWLYLDLKPSIPAKDVLCFFLPAMGFIAEITRLINRRKQVGFNLINVIRRDL